MAPGRGPEAGKLQEASPEVREAGGSGSRAQTTKQPPPLWEGGRPCLPFACPAITGQIAVVSRALQAGEAGKCGFQTFRPCSRGEGTEEGGKSPHTPRLYPA